MKAMIPVAGVGTRLRPHTFSTPKALMPVAGKPILGHILDELLALGVHEVIFIIGHMGDRIKSYVDTRYPFKTRYITQKETLGIAHAVHQCRSYIDDEPILIVLGDTVYNTDFSFLRDGLSESAIGVNTLDGDLRRYGLVETDGGRVTRLVEKPEHPQSNLVIAGVYYLAHPSGLIEAIDELIREGRTTRGEYQLTDALQMMIERGIQMRTFTVDEWFDCGTPERLLSTNRRLLDLAQPSPQVDGSIIVPPVAIAENVNITSSVIGPFVTIANGAEISGSIIANSIVCEDAHLQNCRLNESIVGTAATVKGTAWRVNVGEMSEMVL